MNQVVIQILTLLAASPVLKTDEDRHIVDLFIKLANEPVGGITMLELLAASQFDGSYSHFRHPLADVLAREFVGAVHIGDDSRIEGHKPYTFDAWTEGDEQAFSYTAHLGDVEIVWNPARTLREYERREEQRRRDLDEELEVEAAA